MERKRINSGTLRPVGYDARSRVSVPAVAVATRIAAP